MLRKTAFFLILLRLTIGWHFFFEGWHKIHTDRVGPSETNRPFSSEGYFRNATGPLGPVIRGQLSDPDDAAFARLTPKPIPAGKDVSPAERLPTVLDEEIDDYTKRFLDAFHLDDKEKKQAEKIADDAKTRIAHFLMTSVAEEQHVAEYRAKLAEYRKLSAEKSPALGRDQDSSRLTKIRAEASLARKESLDDLDKEIAKVFRDELSGIVKKKLAGDDLLSVPAGQDPFSFLLPPCDGKALPQPYSGRWDEYFERFKTTYPHTEALTKTAEEKLSRTKGYTVEWLIGKQAIPPSVAIGQLSSPDPLLAYSSAVAARQGLVAEAGEQTEQMKRYLNAALTDEQAKGMPPPVKAEPAALLRRIDLLTMWGLTIIGGCLLLGLLTRTNCVLAAGFLLLTNLAAPPFPWLPSPPNNEGAYLFVNKNLVEMLALLVLATTMSGRWFGLDAILHRIFGRDEKPKTPTFNRARAA